MAVSQLDMTQNKSANRTIFIDQLSGLGLYGAERNELDPSLESGPAASQNNHKTKAKMPKRRALLRKI